MDIGIIKVQIKDRSHDLCCVQVKNTNMIQTIIRLSVQVLLCLQISTIHSQVEKGELFKGKLTTSNITPSEKHHYKLNLEKDQFVFFRLMQKGVDMKITTYNSEGGKLEDFDSPNGKYGPELFTLTSSKKGTYVIEVSPFDEKEPSGNYDLTVEIINDPS
jgi:hypothetical protein